MRSSKTGLSRGYAFVEFHRERDTDYAIQRGQNRRIDGNRVIVDRELGRTKTEWFPRRLGGGKGEKRRVSREEEEFVQKTKSEFAELEVASAV